MFPSLPKLSPRPLSLLSGNPEPVLANPRLFSSSVPKPLTPPQALDHCDPRHRIIYFFTLPCCPCLPGARSQERQCGGKWGWQLLGHVGASLAAGATQAALARKVLCGRGVSGLGGGRPPLLPIPATWWPRITEACAWGHPLTAISFQPWCCTSFLRSRE